MRTWRGNRRLFLRVSHNSLKRLTMKPVRYCVCFNYFHPVAAYWERGLYKLINSSLSHQPLNNLSLFCRPFFSSYFSQRSLPVKQQGKHKNLSMPLSIIFRKPWFYEYFPKNKSSLKIHKLLFSFVQQPSGMYAYCL